MPNLDLLKEKLDALLALATAPREQGIPGLALIVLRKEGTIYSGSSGVDDLDTNRPFGVNTVVWIASMTKAMTSVIAVQAVERGLVGLDEDVSPHVPELKNVQLIDQTSPSWTQESYKLVPAKEPITLRRLLTHSNGLIYGHVYEHGLRYMEEKGIPHVTAAKRAAFAFPSLHEAGQAWHYGMGIDYAGLLIESLYKDRLGHIFQKELRGPLGMDSTVFNLTPELEGRKASLYQRQADGSVKKREDEWPKRVEVDMGGGGSWSTAKDYAKFVRLLLLGGTAPSGQVILSPESYKLGMTGQLEPKAKESCNEFHKLDTTSPIKFQGAKRDYGLIGMVFEDPLPTGRAAGSVQWAGVANCYWMVDATKDVGYVLTAQILPSADPLVQKLLREMETIVYETLGA